MSISWTNKGFDIINIHGATTKINNVQFVLYWFYFLSASKMFFFFI